MVKAIFFDVDGTLVSFKTHRMSAEVENALRTLQDRGVKLFVSTGRTALAMENVKDYPFDGYITMNGALTMIGDEVIDSHPLPREVTSKVAELCRTEHISCWAFADTLVCLNFESDQTREVSEQLQLRPEVFMGMDEVAAEHQIFEYTIYVSKEQEDNLLRPALKGVEYPRWHPYFADIITEGLSKAYGMEKVLSRLGITVEECMAFGDGGNDIPMLEYAGTGVAMGNSSEDVKASADYVTCSVDEDGVVAALRHFGVL